MPQNNIFGHFDFMSSGPIVIGNVSFSSLKCMLHPTLHNLKQSMSRLPLALELQAQYFLKENIVQKYVVPGDKRRRPYEQEVRIKVWGGGGGGCDGGRGESKEPLPEEYYDSDNDILFRKFSEGSGGGYVEAAFRLPVGDTLEIVVGGGGSSAESLSDSLGGKGGNNGGRWRQRAYLRFVERHNNCHGVRRRRGRQHHLLHGVGRRGRQFEGRTNGYRRVHQL